jgi:hypothetical protein
MEGKGGASVPEEQSWNPPDPAAGFAPRPFATGEPLPEPEDSSPLEEDEPEGTIPPAILWAMKDRRHVQWSEMVGFAPERIRDAFGQGDSAVYVIEDGHHHVMLGRQVGTVVDGSQYVLVGRAGAALHEELFAHRLEASSAFDKAEQLTLCGVDIDERDKASDIFVVEVYRDLSAVPDEYLPGHSPIQFSEPLPLEEA